MSKLFEPITIKSISFKNRVVMSPMCQYSATDGFANDWHMVHYGSRAIGGSGLLIIEATGVSPEGRISPGDLGIWKDEHVEPLKRIVDFIHSNGSIAGIQLAHAGRKASHLSPWLGSDQITIENGGWQTVAPSGLPYSIIEEPPAELDEAGIKKIIYDFRSATQRTLEAGFKVLEIHAAHGYLMHEFLSPISNHRTDKYGGSFENRIRLLIEVTNAVKSVWPDNLPLFVRLSATDWVDDGWNLEETVKLASILKDLGVDLIDCSSGGNAIDQKIILGPGYQVSFSDAIRKTGILTGAVGMITSAEQAEKILNEGKADMVLFGRELLRNPYFPLISGSKMKEESEWPVQYLRAKI